MRCNVHTKRRKSRERHGAKAATVRRNGPELVNFFSFFPLLGKASFSSCPPAPCPMGRGGEGWGGVATVTGGHMSWGRRFWSKETIVLVLSRLQYARLPGTGAGGFTPLTRSQTQNTPQHSGQGAGTLRIIKKYHN